MSWNPNHYFLHGLHPSDHDISKRLRDVARVHHARRAVLLVSYRGHISRSLLKVFSCGTGDRWEDQTETSKHIARRLVRYLVSPLSDRGFFQRVLRYPVDEHGYANFPNYEQDCRLWRLLCGGVASDERALRPLLELEEPQLILREVSAGQIDDDLNTRLLFIGNEVRRVSGIRPSANRSIDAARQDPFNACSDASPLSDAVGEFSDLDAALEQLSVTVCASLPVALQQVMSQQRLGFTATDSFALSLKRADKQLRIENTELSQDVFEGYIEKTNSDLMLFFLLRRNESDNKIDHIVSTWPPPDHNGSISRTSLQALAGSGSIQFSLRKRRPLMVNFSGASRDYYMHSAAEIAKALGREVSEQRTELGAYISIPFRLRETVNSDENNVGIALLFAAKWEGVYSAQDFDRLRDYSNFLSDAMADALIFESMESLESISDQGGLDTAGYDSILVRIASQLLTSFQSIVGFDSATLRAIRLHGPGTPKLSRVFAIPESAMYDEAAEISLEESAVTATVAKTGKLIYWPDLHQPHWGTVGLESVLPKNVRNSRSEICAPIRTGNRLIGVINLESRHPNAFVRSRRLVDAIARRIGEEYLREINSRNDRLVAKALLNSSIKQHFMDHCNDFVREIEDLSQCGSLPRKFGDRVKRIKQSLNAIERSAHFENRAEKIEDHRNVSLPDVIENCVDELNANERLRRIVLKHREQERVPDAAYVSPQGIEIFRAVLERCGEHGYQDRSFVYVDWHWNTMRIGGQDFICVNIANDLEHPETEVESLYFEPIYRQDRYHWGCYIDGQSARSLGGSIHCVQTGGQSSLLEAFRLHTIVQLPHIRDA